MDLIDGLEVDVIGKLPDQLFIARDFKDMPGLFTHMTMAEVIAENGVSVRQPLGTGHQAKRIAGHVILIRAPRPSFSAASSSIDLMTIATR